MGGSISDGIAAARTALPSLNVSDCEPARGPAPRNRVSDWTAGNAKASAPSIGSEPKATALTKPSFEVMNFGDRDEVMARLPNL
jgi:hypothetical protein